MNAKDKAKQLYDRAEGYIYTSDAHIAEDDCEKNCALMVCKEVISELNNLPSKDLSDLQYWNEVEFELNSL